MSCIKYICLLLLLFSVSVHAGTMTQTDWSMLNFGPGPYPDWRRIFDTASNIDCIWNPTDVSLQAKEYLVDSAFSKVMSVTTGDVNGDGYIDILGASDANEIAWWQNNDGSGGTWTKHQIDTSFMGAASIDCNDFNGDGYADVVGAAFDGDDITWWENVDGSGLNWVEHFVSSSFNGAYSVKSADMNADGYYDIIAAGFMANDIIWWENTDGSGTLWEEHTVDGNFSGAVSVWIDDVNQDGHLDILGAAQLGKEVVWWENQDGSGEIWVKHTIKDNLSGPTSVHSADVNGDGYIDVLSTDLFSNTVLWWENENGSGTQWTQNVIPLENLFGPCCVCVADINDDGYQDVIVTVLIDDKILWWENLDGSGESWSRHLVDLNFDQARSVHIADVNGDGNSDVLGAATGDNTISWWDMKEYCSTGWLESSILQINEEPIWQTIDWNSTEPTGTSVAFQVRASDNFEAMGEWSDTLLNPYSLSGLIGDMNCYFQYRAILSTSNPGSSPLLHDITIHWLPNMGIEEQEDFSFRLLEMTSNPTINPVEIAFTLSSDSWVSVSVFDIAGRVVYTNKSELVSGLHEIQVNGTLSPGIYLTQITAGALKRTGSFTVIE